MHSQFPFSKEIKNVLENIVVGWLKFVGVSRGYTDHHQGRGHSIRPTAALINIHEHLI